MKRIAKRTFQNVDWCRKQKKYVTIPYSESTKNNSDVQKQNSQDHSDVRMYEIDSHALDPVNVLEFYLQNLHPDNPNLFVKCKKLFSKVDEIWYTKEFIEKHPR